MVEAKIITGMRAVAERIWAGIPQRYPKLRFIVAEGGIGWIPTSESQVYKLVAGNAATLYDLC